MYDYSEALARCRFNLGGGGTDHVTELVGDSTE